MIHNSAKVYQTMQAYPQINILTDYKDFTYDCGTKDQ